MRVFTSKVRPAVSSRILKSSQYELKLSADPIIFLLECSRSPHTNTFISVFGAFSKSEIIFSLSSGVTRRAVATQTGICTIYKKLTSQMGNTESFFDKN